MFHLKTFLNGNKWFSPFFVCFKDQIHLVLHNKLTNKVYYLLPQFRDIFKNDSSLQEKSDCFFLRWLIGNSANVKTTQSILINYSYFCK